MKARSTASLVASLALTWGAIPGISRGRSGAAKGPRPTITLRVVNEGGIERGPLKPAEKEAVRIFSHSGIDLVWLNCDPGQAVWGSGNPCQRELGPAEFWMRIVTRRTAVATADMLGFTDLDESQDHGSAGVYYPAAVEMAAQWHATVGEILGAAIAHEVGHLILGANAHSPSGVMFAHWGRAQFERIGISGLNFTADQARMLREGVERRTAKAVAARR